MKLDVLVFAAHPDDAELSCGGTILSLVASGKKVGIVDLTRGEMGTRGTPEIRYQEAVTSGRILGLSVRENLAFDDVHFTNDQKHQLEVVKAIRKYQPDIILCNAIRDRHPDHAKASQLVVQANFMAGLKKVETKSKGVVQDFWRVKNLYHYIQTDWIQPDFVVDVSDHWEKRMEAVRAFKSQFFDPEGEQSNTLISSPEFINMLDARGIELGLSIRVKYGEGFTVDRNVGVSDLSSLL
ncbi:bacillithiol biosynthesis deacetylase BshB1 [Reichenbachiella sp. MALMAid0571]|uniref:bacillithiol biosynthesis deacetylase BshB1 n=1 Tax=Reichenbachiella sp. MALMAid0571 TaxID=3143939 RepID=UPI0032E03A08